jgi:hypothetical protein
MDHKEAVAIYFDVAGTVHTSVDIAEICDSAADGVAVAIPYSLRTAWRSSLATRVVEDIIYDHPLWDKISDVLVRDEKFQVIQCDNDAEDDSCSRSTAFRRFLETTVSANKTFRVAVRLCGLDMQTLKLNFRHYMAAPNALQFPAGTAAAAVATLAPPTAPNKVRVNEFMETKRFATQGIPSFSRTTDIQRWYNVLHSRALICGVYTVLWKSFSEASPMVEAWSLDHVTQTVLDMEGLMSTALHVLLSSNDIFKGGELISLT